MQWLIAKVVFGSLGFGSAATAVSVVRGRGSMFPSTTSADGEVGDREKTRDTELASQTGNVQVILDLVLAYRPSS